MESELLDGWVRMIRASALSIPLPDDSVDCCVTSPPYWGLRNYLNDPDQIGQEKTPQEYVEKLVAVFQEVRRVLRRDGTLWLNLGDSYNSSAPGNKNPMSKSGLNGAQTSASYRARLEETQQRQREHRGLTPALKPKNLIGIPWLVAFALQADGWYLRSDIIWAKPNPMPESVQDRPTRSHEYIFLLSKSERYYYDIDAIKEPMALSSIPRLMQNVEEREGSYRANGGTKTNGTMKAVGKVDKRRGHSRRHAGFNDRWDQMTRVEQCSGMRNKRDVWFIATQPFKGAHFATFPPKLIEPCILAGCPENGLVLDPFGGSGTTGKVAADNNRQAVLLDINYKDEPRSYLEIARDRILATPKSVKKVQPTSPTTFLSTVSLFGEASVQ